MAIAHIHTYLVYPRDLGEHQSGGAAVPLEGKLFELLRDVYAKSDAECDIDISFNATDGAQQNPLRDLVLSYLQAPELEAGRAIAQELKAVTTNRSVSVYYFSFPGSRTESIS